MFYRITGFLDAWPKLEKWFNKFGILKKIDATLAADVLYLEVEKVLEDTLKKLQGVEEEESMPVEVTTEEVKEEPPVSLIFQDGRLAAILDDDFD